VNWGWDEYAALNIMRGSVIVTYAPNSSSFTSFAASAKEHRPNDLYRAGLIAPSRSVAKELAPENESILARAESTPDDFPPTLNPLTSRQRDVLNLIVQGRSNKEIARTLDLAEGTVKIHVAALFGKLGVRRRAALAVAGAALLQPVRPLPTEYVADGG